MAEFQMKIAGAVARVRSLFESTPQFFREYLTDEPGDFSITVQPEDLIFEQSQLDEEARTDGFKRRQFTDPFLERTAIQRGFAEHLLHRDTLLLHGSAVAVDGEGYLFMARSGTGKSTHTRLWREAFGDRAVMVNDDKPFLHLGTDGLTMFGSPWSGKHGLDRNISVPLRGVCLLERGAENRIVPLEGQQMLAMLQHQAYQPLAQQEVKVTLQLIERLVQQVPFWHMHCTKDPVAAYVAYEAMKKV